MGWVKRVKYFGGHLKSITIEGILWWSKWLGLWAFTAKDAGSIPGWGTKILQALQHSQREKNKIKTVSLSMFIYTDTHTYTCT